MYKKIFLFFLGVINIIFFVVYFYYHSYFDYLFKISLSIILILLVYLFYKNILLISIFFKKNTKIDNNFIKRIVLTLFYLILSVIIVTCLTYKVNNVLLVFSLVFILLITFFVFLKKLRFFLFHEIKLSFTSVFIFFICFIILLVNIFSILNLNEKGVNFTDLLLMELNIIYQVTSLFVFDLIFIFILWSFGSRILKFAKLNELTDFEMFIFSFGFGIFPLILSTFVLATTGGLYLKYLLWILIVFLIFSYREVIDNYYKAKNLVFKIPNSGCNFDKNVYKKIVLLVILITVGFLFFYTVQPTPIDIDSLHTYFNVPNIFLENHRFVNFSLFPFANIPNNISLLYINIIALFGPRFLSHIQLIYLIFTLFGIYAFSKRFFNQTVGLLAVLFYFYIPAFLLRLVNSVKIELSLGYYSLLIIYSYFIWLGKPKWIWAIILGILFGFTFGIKYTTGFLVLSLLVCSLFYLAISLFKKNQIKPYINSFFVILLFFIIFFPLG